MKTVLIADDQPSIRMLVAATLSSLDDVTVIQASDGDEAWSLFQEHRPDLALLDVQMPGRTGLDLTEAIRRHPGFAGVPIVLLTAGAAQSEVEAGIASGANEYLVKPFSPINLRHRVESLLAIRT